MSPRMRVLLGGLVGVLLVIGAFALVIQFGGGEAAAPGVEATATSQDVPGY